MGFAYRIHIFHLTVNILRSYNSTLFSASCSCVLHINTVWMGKPTLTSNIFMLRGWIIGRNRLVKLTIRKCMTCQHNKPQSAQQPMGDLPADQVNPERPWKYIKDYITVLICFSTQAVHLEVVSNLTTAGFICGYRRLAGRRGICKGFTPTTLLALVELVWSSRLCFTEHLKGYE